MLFRSFGSGSSGSPSHLAGELYMSLTQSKILLVPYKGATFALVGAMSGEVDMVIPAATAVAPYVKDKRMRALAVLDARPLAFLPGVPTSAQAGMPQMLVVNWYLLAAPAGAPQAIIDFLNVEVNKVMRADDTRKHFQNLGGETLSISPEQSATFLREEYGRWGKVIRDANIRPE